MCIRRSWRVSEFPLCYTFVILSCVTQRQRHICPLNRRCVDVFCVCKSFPLKALFLNVTLISGDARHRADISKQKREEMFALHASNSCRFSCEFDSQFVGE